MDIYSEKKAMKDLNSLYAEAVYGKPKSAGQELASREKRDDAAGAPKKMIVTRADKKANTTAYQNYKKGVKGYAAADHLKNEEYAELYATMNEKKADKDYDGDGKVESGTAEYKGSKDKAIKKAMAKEEKEKGIDGKACWKGYKHVGTKKKGGKTVDDCVKVEGFSSWRNDLSEVLTATEKEVDKEVKETKVKNKVVIDPEVKLEQALGGKVESIQEEECDECGSEEHTTEEHEMSVKEEILLDRAVVALSEMNIDEDIADIIARLEKKRISKGGNPDDSPLPAMKKYHADKKKKAAKAEK